MAEQISSKASISRMSSGSKKGGNLTKKIIFLAVVVVILGGLFYWIVSNSEGAVQNYPKDKWQAVFLSNGQVYFGHIKQVTKESVVLESIYYLQVVTAPLQRSQDSAGAANEQEQRLTLIKLGNEIHGPYDRMNINRDHVVLLENLKDDSRVVEAITRYVSEQQQ